MVGLGTDGELKMPGYGHPSWNWPGIGQFQCFDRQALASLARAAAAAGQEDWSQPPVSQETGSYNSRWDETEFFTAGYKSERGRFFLDWYSASLKDHAVAILQDARAVFGRSIKLSAKVAGVHWLYKTPSHAAELTAGYYNTNNRDGYKDLAEAFAASDVILDFTCMEMTDGSQPDQALSGPQELVEQVSAAARSARVSFSGENALAFYRGPGFNQMLTHKAELKALTFLRLGPDLVQPDNLAALRAFAAEMRSSIYSTPFSLEQ